MTNPQEGFGGAQAALNDAKHQTTWINQQVNDGKLRMNPESAEAAAKYCEETETKIEKIRAEGQYIAQVDGLGDYDESLKLKHHFEQKANHPQSGALALLDQLRTELLNLADTYRNAAKAYRAQEEHIQDGFKKGLP